SLVTRSLCLVKAHNWYNASVSMFMFLCWIEYSERIVKERRFL
ncbi:19115_t:CDS:1, partial [Entrophospora sp. SA101]